MIGQVEWIDAAIDDTRLMLISAGTRSMTQRVAAKIDEIAVPTVGQAYRVHLHNGSRVGVIDVPARNGGDASAGIARLDENIRFLTGKSAVWSRKHHH